MKQEVAIRKAEEADIEAVSGLCLEVNPFSETGEQNPVDYWRSFFLGCLHNDETALLVAETRSKIVGFAYAVIENSPDDCVRTPYVSFDLLGVHESFRGLGIASSLAEAVESWARLQGVGVIQLAVAEANTTAFALYQRLGYSTVMRKMQKKL